MANTKSTSITNLDSQPFIQNTTGQGAQGELETINDLVAVTTAVAVNDTFQVVRIPWQAKIKQVLVNSVTLAATTLTFSVNVNYSDSQTDYTPILDQGVQVVAGLFGSAIDLHTAVKQEDITFSGSFTLADMNQPLWTVAGLSADPGGKADIVLECASVATATAGGSVSVEVRFVE